MRDGKTTIALGDICGIAEVAEIIGKTKGRINQLMTEDKNFPRPVWTLRLGRLWDRNEIVAWMRATGYNMPRQDGNKPEQNKTGPKPAPVVRVPDAERAARLDALLRG